MVALVTKVGMKKRSGIRCLHLRGNGVEGVDCQTRFRGIRNDKNLENVTMCAQTSAHSELANFAIPAVFLAGVLFYLVKKRHIQSF